MSKWLLINIENFSPRGGNKLKTLTRSSLPPIIQKQIELTGDNCLYILDESSKIKTTQAMPEHKKSTRSRVIKMLQEVGERVCLTGTLMSKSPVNAYDQMNFLQKNFFPENMYEFAEKYCILETLPIGRGRRVLISKKSYMTIRTTLENAYNRGGKVALRQAKQSIMRYKHITADAMLHIAKNPEYTPFRNLDDLRKRMSKITHTVKRSQVFDVSFEKYVLEPIVRKVEISNRAKKLGNQLVKLGFTENLTLSGKASLELYHRLQDLCNGLEPIKDCDTDEVVKYEPLKENPKLDEIKDLLDSIGVEDNQVVIFSSRTNFTMLILDMLEKENIMYTTYNGLMTKEEKSVAEDAIRTKKVQVMVANPASAGYGLNSLRNVDYCIYACVDGSVERFVQSKYRLLRGQLDHLKFAYVVLTKNSIEERVYDRLQTGEELLSAGLEEQDSTFA